MLRPVGFRLLQSSPAAVFWFERVLWGRGAVHAMLSRGTKGAGCSLVFDSGLGELRHGREHISNTDNMSAAPPSSLLVATSTPTMTLSHAATTTPTSTPTGTGGGGGGGGAVAYFLEGYRKIMNVNLSKKIKEFIL